MKLNQLADKPGARQSRKRQGRGIGSGKGKTSGHGHKGQKSRSGVALKGFEGGQMPLSRRLPKRGFSNHFRKHYRIVNLGRLQRAIDEGKIDAKNPVTADSLAAAGIIRSSREGVRLLAKGEISAKITVEAAGASRAAVAAVEKAGGTVTLIAQAPTPSKSDAKASAQSPAKSPAPSKDAPASGAPASGS